MPKKKKPANTLGEVETILATLKRLGNKTTRDDMGKRYGIVGPTADKSFGVPMAKMLKLSKELGRNHELALALWETGWYEARMVACMIDEPKRVTGAQMDAWCSDFDNWGICDTVCFKLFDQVPHAYGKVKLWAKSEEEFIKRGAFALLACLALHDKSADDDRFLEYLSLIDSACDDDRNFVKKALLWAMRGIGGRGPELRAEVIILAQKLAISTIASARWVGKSAMRELSKSR